MKMIVGLGNPGDKYRKTRHNTGFMVMDEILKKLNLTLDKEKFKAMYTIYNDRGRKTLFVKPLTFMNLSGEAVKPLMKFYDIDVEDVLIIHDDLDLPVGKVRLRGSGSCGGQNGMRNIIDLLGTKDIKRIRVGVGKDKNIPTIEYVMGKVREEDLPEFEKSIVKARDAALFFMDNDDFSLTMNRYNI